MVEDNNLLEQPETDKPERLQRLKHLARKVGATAMAAASLLAAGPNLAQAAETAGAGQPTPIAKLPGYGLGVSQGSIDLLKNGTETLQQFGKLADGDAVKVKFRDRRTGKEVVRELTTFHQVQVVTNSNPNFAKAQKDPKIKAVDLLTEMMPYSVSDTGIPTFAERAHNPNGEVAGVAIPTKSKQDIALLKVKPEPTQAGRDFNKMQPLDLDEAAKLKPKLRLGQTFATFSTPTSNGPKSANYLKPTLENGVYLGEGTWNDQKVMIIGYDHLSNLDIHKANWDEDRSGSVAVATVDGKTFMTGGLVSTFEHNFVYDINQTFSLKHKIDPTGITKVDIFEATPTSGELNTLNQGFGHLLYSK